MSPFRRAGIFAALLSIALGSLPWAALGADRKAILEGKILIDARVPKAQAELLVSDLKRLGSLEFEDADPELLRILDTPRVSGPSLRDWIEERIRYIVHQDAFKTSGNGTIKGPVEIIHEKFHYPNEGPEEREAPQKSATKGDAPKMMVKATHLSGAIYAEGRRRRALLGFNFPGADLIPVTSPRAGILLIGEGLFRGQDGGPLFDAGSFRNFALRVGTLLHEARHSDGNGKSLTFAHDFCPNGHSLQNSPSQSCDRSRNGPYAIEAGFFRTLIRSCKNCSRDDLRELARASIATQNRVVRWWPEMPVSPEAEKRVAAEQLISGCDLLGESLAARGVCDDESALREARKTLENLRQIPGTSAGDWDATPEFALPNQ